MHKRIITLTTIVFATLLSSCSQFDDYMLGKDNTPTPKQLTSIESKLTFTKEWTVALGKNKTNSGYLKLKPLLAGHKIYVASPGGVFEAVNKRTGTVAWSTKTPYTFISGPSLGDGLLFLTTSNSRLVAFSQADGHQLWSKKLSGDALSAPIIADNQVITKTIDGNLYSFALPRGEKRWFIQHGSPSLVLKASSSPVMLNGQVALVGYADGKLDAVDVHTGHLLWQRSIVYASGSSDVERLIDIDADPIVSGNIVYLGSYQGYVGAMSLTDGQFIWRKPASIYKDMVLSGNALYYTDSHDVVWAMNNQTGQVNWKQPALKARNLTEPSLQSGRLFVGDKTGLLHVMDAATGELVARAPMKGAVYVAPLVSGNRLYILTAANELSCYLVS